MRDATGVTWLLAGLHGSTQLAINDTTGTVSRERYLPFGQRRGGDDLPFTDRGFLGKIEDASTGLTYLGARYYDPAIAKFISTDPELDLRTPEWANPYSYAANNPIDPIRPRRPPRRHRRRQHRQELRLLPQQETTQRQPELRQNPPSQRQEENQPRTQDPQKAAAEERDISRKKGAEKRRQEATESAIAKMPSGNKRTGLSDGNKWTHGRRRAGAKVGSTFPSGANDEEAHRPGKTRTIKSKSGPCSSFVPGTKVLMADGATKPIEDIKTGDKVIATDPTTGKTTARKVLAPITSKGVKNLVRVTVGSGDEAGVFTATGEHPFWVPTTRQWQQANMLWPGQYLRTGGEPTSKSRRSPRGPPQNSASTTSP